MLGSSLHSLPRRAVLGAAALPLFSQQTGTPASEWPRFARKIRVGMVGLEGHPSEVYGVVAKHPDLALTAIARDQVPVAGLTRRREFRETKVYEDFKSMFERETFDVMAVCNTNGHRAAVIVEAARRGWHVVAEKPVALSDEELTAVRNAVSRAGIGFTSLLPMRYESEFYTMARLARSGAIGDTRLMNAQKSYKMGSRAEWFKDPALYGSTMQWIGVHMVDLMYWIGRTGFRSAYSYERNVGEPGNGGMQNVTGAVFELENGGVATLNMDYFRPEAAATHGDDRLRVAGTKGILEYRMQDGLFALGSGDRTSVKPPIEAPPYPLFLDFLLHIYQQREMLIRPEEVFQVVEIVNAARRSSDGGCAIHVGT